MNYRWVHAQDPGFRDVRARFERVKEQVEAEEADAADKDGKNRISFL